MSDTQKPLPIKFGEYNQNFKSIEQIEEWYKIDENFRQGKYKDGIINLLNYLYNPVEGNVQSEDLGDDSILFQVYQGSTCVHGFYKDNALKAVTTISKLENLSPVIMRRALDRNVGFYYSKIGLDDENNLVMILNFPSKNFSANDLYYGIREVALKTDQMDDDFVESFGEKSVSMLQDFKYPVPLEEAHIKYTYIIKWIDETLEVLSKNNRNEMYASSIFLTLNLIHRIYYMCGVKGGLDARLSKISAIYWDNTKDNKLNYAEVLGKQIQMFTELKDMPEEEFDKYLYRTRDTFTNRTAVSFATMAQEIKLGLDESRAYKKQGNDDYALSILEYSIGNLIYDFNVPLIASDLYHLQMMVFHKEFFKALGVMKPVFEEDGITFNREFIQSYIEESLMRNILNIPDFKFDINSLVYEDDYAFCESVSNALFNSFSMYK